MYRVPLNASTIGDEEKNAVLAVLQSDRLTMGPRCEAFEESFSNFLGVRNAVMVNSGSSANLLAVFALANPQITSISRGRRQLQPGDEVIVPAVSWATSVWPIAQAGCVPVFVDSDPLTLQTSAAEIEAALSPRTAAVMAVHVLGNAVEIEPVVRICDRHGLWLIEDTCESLGVKHQGRLAGTFGEMGTYSFFFSHHMTTVEGGMVVTDDDNLADLLRAMRAHGWVRDLRQPTQVTSHHPELDDRFLFWTTGFNLRPTEINAAIGQEQLRKLGIFNNRRIFLAARLNEGLKGEISQGRLRPMAPTPGTEPVLFGFPVVCENSSLRNSLRDHLEANGIETRPIICGNMVRQPALATITHRVSGDLAGADRIMETGCYWGLHPLMTDADVDFTLQVIQKFFRP